MPRMVLLLVLVGLPDDTGEQFYKFPKDTVWTYSIIVPEEADKKDKMTLTLIGEKDAKVWANMVAQGRTAKSAPMAWYVADGCLCWAERKGDRIEGPLGLYKLGSKKGDSWTLPASKFLPAQTTTHLGAEEVKVPAGLYKDAIHVRVQMLEDRLPFQVDVFLVAKIGMVKMVHTLDDRQRLAYELDEFKPAK